MNDFVKLPEAHKTCRIFYALQSLRSLMPGIPKRCFFMRGAARFYNALQVPFTSYAS